jgi:hypothetical protein
MPKYSAKLLYRFRVSPQSKRKQKYTCIESIVVFTAKDPESALDHCMKVGGRNSCRYRNTDGRDVKLEFLGVMDMERITSEFDKEEVWYDVRERLLWPQRIKRLIPTRKSLLERSY